MTQSDTISAGTRDMIISRRFEAPVERVWQAWTEPDQVRQWWGPAGFTAPLAEMDVREGGASLVCMRAPWGQDFYNTWTYETIVPMARLDFVQRFADPAWQPDRADHHRPAAGPAGGGAASDHVYGGGRQRDRAYRRRIGLRVGIDG